MPDPIDDKTRKAQLKEVIHGFVDERIEAMEGRISKDMEDQISGSIKQALAAAGKSGGRIFTAGAGGLAMPRYVLRSMHDPREIFEKGKLPASGLRMDLDVGESSMRGQHSALRFRRKSYEVAQDVAGGRVEAIAPWYAPYSMGAFRNCGATVISGVGKAKVTVPNIGTFSYAEEATVNSSRTSQGELSSAEVVIKNFVAQAEYSHPAVEDVPGLAGMVGMALEQAAASTEDAEIYKLLKTGANSGAAGTVGKVKTGSENALPGVGTLIDKLAEVKESVTVANRGDMACWVVSKGIERKLMTAGPQNTAATQTFDYAFNPRDGLTMLFGEPVEVSDHMGDGDTADDLSAVYGGFNRAVFICVNELYMIMTEHAKLGSYTWYSAFRFAPHLANDVAVAGLVNEA